MQQNSGLPTFGNASLRGLARLRDAKRRRASSWDRTGGNEDCLTIPAGETATLGDIGGAGSITHIWFTISSADPVISAFRCRGVQEAIFIRGEQRHPGRREIGQPNR